MSSFEQVFNAGGPDPGRLTAAAQLTALGTMLARQQHVLGLDAQHFFKFSDFSAPLARPQLTLKQQLAFRWWLPIPADFAYEVPAGEDGLTIGTGNAAVRVVAKSGWSVRFGIINPGTDGTTGTYYLASHALEVKVSIVGRYAEIWVLAANDASIATTSLASEVRDALTASTDAMRALSTVDFNGGDGTGVVVAATSRALSPVAIAATVSDSPGVVPGRFYLSFDGDMALLNNNFTGNMVADYMAAPALPLAENEYPGT